MFGSSLTRTLAVLTLTGALVAAPAGAEAGSRTHPDPRGDMVTGERAPAPGQVNGDVIKVRMRHTGSRVRVRITLADLSRGDTIANFTNLAVVTNEGVRRYVNSAAWAGRWAGRVQMNRRDGTLVRCAIHHTNDYAANVVVIGFSRRCVSRPRWVRISVRAGTAVSAGDGVGVAPLFIDDGLRNGMGPWDGVLSPRLHRH